MNGDANTQGEPEVPIANPPGRAPGIEENPAIISELLPERLFATDRYPQEGRINSYSKPEYLLDIVDVLQDTEEFATLRNSPLGSLFDLPVRKSSLSGKLVHNILCRSLHTSKRHELWFVFGGHPLRFSLREYALVTGLPCGPYPPPEIIKAAQKPKGRDKPYWDTLIGNKTKVISINEIVNTLRRDQRLPPGDKMQGWKRLRLCLIVIVEGILICNSQPVRASNEVVEMVKDLEFFFSYPWGRESFELTLRMVKVGSKVGRVEELVDKLMQSHTATHGFILSLQLLILQAIPLLDNYLPDTDDEQTFTDRSIIQLSKLKTFHNANIIEAENNPELEVYPIIESETNTYEDPDYSWADEVPDPGVNYIVSLINRRYNFSKGVWLGGYDGMPLIPLPRPIILRKLKKKKRTRKEVLEKGDDLGEGSSRSIGQEFDSKLLEHKKEIREIILTERSVIKAEVKAEVLAEVLAQVFLNLTDSGIMKANPKSMDHNTNTTVDNNIVDNLNMGDLHAGGTHTDILKHVNNSFWGDYIGVHDVLNSLKSHVGDEAPIDRHGPHRDTCGNGLSKNKALFESVHEGEEEGLLEDHASCSDDLSSAHEETEIISVPLRGLRNDGGQQSPRQSPGAMGAHHVGEDVDAAKADDVNENLIGDENIKDCVDEVNQESVDEDNQETVDEDNPETVDENKIGTVDENEGEAVDQSDSEQPIDDNTEDGGHSTSEDEDISTHRLMSTEEDAVVVANIEGELNGKDRVFIPDASLAEDAVDFSEQIMDANESPDKVTKSRKRDLTTETPYVPDKRVKRLPSRYRSTPHQVAGKSRVDGYCSLENIEPALRKKFLSKLSSYRQKQYIIDGHPVPKSFFNELLSSPTMVDDAHMEAMLNLIWRKLRNNCLDSRIAVLDTLFTNMICNEYPRFKKWKKPSGFQWNSLCRNYVRGNVPTRSDKLTWFQEVDNIYVPMKWKKGHWVALLIKLKEAEIMILDPLISGKDIRKVKNHVKPLLDMLPCFLVDQFQDSQPSYDIPTSFSLSIFPNLSQTDRIGDSGPFAVKLIELHLQGLPIDGISDDMVDQFRLKYAMDVYDEFVSPFRP